MNLREEIINIIEDHLQGNETGIYGQEKAADDIIKAIEKHGYRKVETIDGYWSD